ncbi:MAG: DUF2848 family protein [Promethearchaeota archaeon]
MTENILPLTVQTLRGKYPIRYSAKNLFCLGFTGRNKALVLKHMEEAREIGIICQGVSVPLVLPVSPARLTTGSTIHVEHEKTSGEVEYVILVDGSRTYVAVGSDHTDREMEKHDLKESKDAVPKIMSSTVWLYEEVEDHWDELIMRSWIRSQGNMELYQDGKLELLLKWNDLISIIKDHIGEELSGTIVFAGTIPTIKRQMLFTDTWKLEMFDPVLKRSLKSEYTVRIIS